MQTCEGGATPTRLKTGHPLVQVVVELNALLATVSAEWPSHILDHPPIERDRAALSSRGLSCTTYHLPPTALGSHSALCCWAEGARDGGTPLLSPRDQVSMGCLHPQVFAALG